MLTLALEHSTSEGSAALLRDKSALLCESWNDTVSGQRQLLGVIEGILNKAGCLLSDIDLFASGLGPGAYTNMRISVSTAQGFAVPGRKPVRGISSAEAVAWDLALARNTVGHHDVKGGNAIGGDK